VSVDVTLRHHVPGRTRLAIFPWPQKAALEATLARLAARGFDVVSSNPHSRSVLLRHPRTGDGEAVAAAFRSALAGAPEPPATQPARSTVAVRTEAPSDFELASVLTSAEIMRRFESTPIGLSRLEAGIRITRHGPNVAPAPSPRSRREMLLAQIATFPVALLFGSAVLSVATGGFFDAAVTVGVVIVNAVIGFASENATERLVRQLSRPVEHVATVLRDGIPISVPAREIVPGDVILLTPGSFVPADGRLLDAIDLTIDESLLTGESLPAVKIADALAATPSSVAQRANLVHAGTIVTGGNGRALICFTGARTENARTRALIGEARPPRPAMETKLAALASRAAIACIGASGIVLGIGLLRGEPALAVIKSAIALAVAAIPEGLPAVATTTLSMGAKAMERDGIFVRTLPSVETIGGIDTICLDKTGTLTQNRMEVVAALIGSTLAERGRGDAWPMPASPELEQLLAAVTLCNEADIAADTGSSTEQALLFFARDHGLDVARIRDDHPSLRVWSRNHRRRFMASAHADGNGMILAVKGAPDEVLALATHEGAGKGTLCLTKKRRDEILEANRALASSGLRVLGVALRRRSDSTIEADDGHAMLEGLVWIGLVALADPVRPEAREAIDIFHRAGIRTIMLTGDQPETALAVAHSLALSRSGIIPVVESKAIAGLDDAALGHLALTTSVFARVSPAEKLRIVRALQGAGRRVAMIGDGINDGPALRLASVGVAMGRAGTDVAREVADIVIADDDLRRLARAVARGRSTHDNVRAALRYFLSTNLSEVLVMLGETLHGRGEAETPMELFWLNLVTDVLPALGLALAEPSGDVMARGPRAATAPLLDKHDAKSLLLDSAGMGGAALTAHFIALARKGIGPQMRTSTFTTLALSQVAQAWVLRDRSPSSPDALIVSRRRLEAALLASLGLVALPLALSPLQRLLGIGPLRADTLASAIGLAGVSFATAETRRIIARVGTARATPPVAAAPARSSPVLRPARTA